MPTTFRFSLNRVFKQTALDFRREHIFMIQLVILLYIFKAKNTFILNGISICVLDNYLAKLHSYFLSDIERKKILIVHSGYLRTMRESKLFMSQKV